MFRAVLGAYFKIFFITKYNTIVKSFLYIFIGIIKYLKKLLYLIQFYTGFLSQNRVVVVKIEVGGSCG